MSLRDAKQNLRRRIAARIGAMDPSAREAADAKLREELARLPERHAGLATLGYAPLSDEVNLWPILADLQAAGGVVVLPRVEPGGGGMRLHRIDDLDADLEAGTLGIREPRRDRPVLQPGDLDLVLVPGRAFDLSGTRLGRGGGYYDRLLARTRALRVALLYDEQLVEAVPADEHDLPVHVLITPTRTVRVQLRP
jgi:5-formyltetrahydrofolate cyclo-ligase